ncbi:MAG: MFS transporter, partial [Pseudomonadota bacterium]
LIVIGFLAYFAMALFETIMPLWAAARFDWGPRNVGYSFAYLGLIVTIVQLGLVGRLAPIFGESKLVMAGLASYAFGLIVMTQAPTWPFMMFGITFTAAGSPMVITSMSSLVSTRAGDGERGLVLGVYHSGGWMGRAGGPPVAGLLFDGIGVQAPLYAAALIMAPCLLLIGRVRARIRRREAEA